MPQSVQDQVIAIVAEQAIMDVSEVKLDATLEELGIDSLGLVEAVFAIVTYVITLPPLAAS